MLNLPSFYIPESPFTFIMTNPLNKSSPHKPMLCTESSSLKYWKAKSYAKRSGKIWLRDHPLASWMHSRAWNRENVASLQLKTSRRSLSNMEFLHHIRSYSHLWLNMIATIKANPRSHMSNSLESLAPDLLNHTLSCEVGYNFDHSDLLY